MTIDEIISRIRAAQARLLELDGNSEVRDNLLKAEAALNLPKAEIQDYLKKTTNELNKL